MQKSAPDSAAARQPPAGESSEHDQQLALLRAASLIALGVIVFFVPVDLLAGRLHDRASVTGFVLLGISAFVGLFYHHLGLPRAGWIAILGMLWCTETTFALFHGGINAPSVMFYLPMVAAVAIVLGGSAALFFAAVCVATMATLAWAEASGNLPQIPFQLAPWRRAVIYGAATAALALVMTYGIAQERKRRDALKRASERFQTVFSSSATPSVIARPSDRIFTDCNEAFCSLFGYTRDEVIGRTSLDLQLFRDLGDRERGFAEFLAAGRVFNAELDMVTATGDIRRVLRSLTAIDMGGEPMVLVQIVDITERKRAEDELRANRRLLETVIDAIPMSIFAKDKKSNYVMVNQGMADFYAQTKDTLLRRHTLDLPTPDETRQKSLRDDEWVFANLAVLDQPLAMLQRPDGVFVAFHSTKIPMFNDDGELIGLLGINRDITEERRAQEELRANRRLLEIVIDSMPMLIFVKDLQGRYVVVNRRCADFYGTSKETILASGLANLSISDATRKKVFAEDAQVFESRETLVLDATRAEYDSGKAAPVHSTKIPLFDDDGKLVGLLGVVRDITEEKRAADELHAARRAIEEANISLEKTVELRTAELKRANIELGGTLENLVSSQAALVRAEKLAALGRLVAGVAHELNTPIGNSLLSASALADRTDEFARDTANGNQSSTTLSVYVEDAREASQILLRNLEKAGEIIRSFKQVAVDQTSSKRRTFALAEIVDEVLLAHRPMLRNSPVVIHTDIPADILLDSYPGPLGQVLGNLITNALLHGYEAGDHGVVEISAALSDATDVQIIVRDHGCGISEEDLKRIFDPFFTTRMGRGGTGLGLGICHNIVTETLAGTINVESRLEVGTSVFVRIPVTTPNSASAAIVG